MPESHACRGARRGRRLLADLGAELRAARTALRVCRWQPSPSAAGISPTELSRVRARARPVAGHRSPHRGSAPFVGLDLAVRAFPGGNPLRDAGPCPLIAAFRAFGSALASVVRTEVPDWPRTRPSSVGPDRRGLRADTAAVEFETRLTRRPGARPPRDLKYRDSGIAPVILVVSDTRATGMRSRRAGSRARGRCSRSTLTAILAPLAAGRVPGPAGSSSFASAASDGAARPADAARRLR